MDHKNAEKEDKYTRIKREAFHLAIFEAVVFIGILVVLVLLFKYW